MIRSRRSFGWTIAAVLIVTFVLVGMQRWAYATTLRDRLDTNGIFRTTTPPPPTQDYEEVVQDHKNSSSAVESGQDKNVSDVVRPDRKGIHHDPASNCEWLPDTSNILLVMKTGASESFNKIPTQLMTTLRCLADFYIFSDMAQTIAGVPILDSLDTVLESAKAENKDFDLYRNQMRCPVDQELCNKGGDSASQGWNLDKYKNIHMAEKTYRMKPNYDWYIFIDADSYVLWPNMVRWLSNFKPTDKRYLGSAAMIGNHPFGHGGSGYVVSQATMKAFIGDNPGIANKYDEEIKDNCCGDFVFAKALKEVTGVGVENSWPTINGEKPYTLPFGPTHWCHAVVTMHHLAAEETSMFWEWEKEFYRNQTAEGTSRPLLLKDIFFKFLQPKLVEKREDWDNNSDNQYYLNATAKTYEKWQLERAKTKDLSPVEQEAHKSFEHCRAMCEEVEECMQFRFQDGICTYSKAMLLGQPKHEKDESKRWTSGWPLQKIQKWIEKQGECKKPIWPNV